ncbi:MAG TPA: GIY-YIG nuclease family protein [Gammaproteobacteria bacterium]
MAKSVGARILEHNAGRGAKYTRGRLPVELVYREVCVSRSAALKRESEIKRLSARAKREFVERSRPAKVTRRASTATARAIAATQSNRSETGSGRRRSSGL